MPHDRKRYLLPIIAKKLRFSPVVSIQGARQTGKSFLARELLGSSSRSLEYVTFDRGADRAFASKNPEAFILQHSEAHPLVIDEAQKVPEVFDAVKYSVDSDRRPGRFLLLGSTEFSHLHKIRESLTGRMTRARLYPFTLRESLQLPLQNTEASFFIENKGPVARKELVRFLSGGGLPGIFAIRSAEERSSLLSDWIDLAVERDIHQIPKIRADSTVARRILEGIARLEHPDEAAISRFCGRDARLVKRHIQLLKELFILEELQAHPSGTGKAIYFICDVGLAANLGASFERQLYTWLVLEMLSKRAYLDQRDRSFFYYRNSKGAIVELLEERAGKVSALKLLSEERFDIRQLSLLRSVGQKIKNSKCFALGATRASLKDEKIEIYPWESVS